MSKILILTAVVLAAGTEAIQKAFTDHPADAAADVLQLEKARAAAVATAEAALAELEKQPVVTAESKPVFILKDGSYGFNFPSMMHKGKRITIEDVLADENLQHELVAMGSGMVYHIG